MMETYFAFLQVAMRPKFNLDARFAATSDFSTSLTLHWSRWLELELISAFDCLVFGFSQINNAGHFECLSISCNANFGRGKVHGHASPSACHKIDFRPSRQLNYRGSSFLRAKHTPWYLTISDSFRTQRHFWLQSPRTGMAAAFSTQTRRIALPLEVLHYAWLTCHELVIPIAL